GVEEGVGGGGVGVRTMGGGTGRSGGGRKIGGVDVVLERERHAVQRSQPLAAPALLVGADRRGAQASGLEADESVELRRRAARQQRLGQILGRKLAVAYRLCRLADAKLRDFHHRVPLYSFRWGKAIHLIEQRAYGEYDEISFGAILTRSP